MLIIMKEDATQDQIQQVTEYIENKGFGAHISVGDVHTVIGAVGPYSMDKRDIELLDGVKEVIKITSNYKLASRVFQKEDTIINVNSVKFGGGNVGIIAGPCTIESYSQMDEIASQLKDIGVKIIRGGAFKPRTSPYAFQGLGEDGLRIIRDVADKYNMAVTSEVMENSQIPMFLDYVDILQVGARNMQNFNLLKDLSTINKPVLIKRGFSATYEEWLMSAEYVLSGGNRQVILCERGIRTFEKLTRNTMDLAAIPVIKKLSHLPIITDPSHGTGMRDKVKPMSLASIACGCDGLIIETHHKPEEALCDGAQSLYPSQLSELLIEADKIANVVNKNLNLSIKV